MFTLSKEEFNKLQPRNGIIVVEIEGLYHKQSEGINLTVSSDYAMAQNAIKHGIVVKVSPSNNPEGFSGKQYVPLLQKGDIVHFDYTIGMNILLSNRGQSTSNDNLLAVEDKRYVLVPYSLCFYRERNGEPLSLNGYVIASKIPSKKGLYEIEEPELMHCEMDSTEAIFDRPTIIPKKGQCFYYDGTPVPTEPEYIGKKQLFKLFPYNIYATI
jgi:hypothetical protein